MTKKDYVKIAAVFSQYVAFSQQFQGADMRATHARELAVRLADMLAQDNPRFDESRFIDACGL